ncbi:MAG: hypothetical protein J2O49_00790 [Sciscionella sp.]|nr:hypothetical protein [Sciscionella sp.]
MKLAMLPGITPVSLRSVEQTEQELAELIVKHRGSDSVHDPGVPIAAREVAELAHDNGAGLAAVLAHPSADPGLLFGVLVNTPSVPRAEDVADLRCQLEDSGGANITEVTETTTANGYPVVVAERIVAGEQIRSGDFRGCQLQAIVLDPKAPRIAVLTLNSPTGNGWLALATLFGNLVSTVEFSN